VFPLLKDCVQRDISQQMLCFSGNKAFRDMTKGSWFINAIANIFMRSAKNTHVVDMLTKASRSLSDSLFEWDNMWFKSSFKFIWSEHESLANTCLFLWGRYCV